MKKLCVKLVIYNNHARMHGQQNIKIFQLLGRKIFLYCVSQIHVLLF